MLSILLTLLPIFGIMGLGILAERRHMLPASTATCLNQFVYWFSLPLLLFYQMASMRPEQISAGAAAGFVLGLATAYALIFSVQKMLKDEPKACYTVALVGTFCNGAFMGMPIIFLLLPGDSVAAVAASLAVVLTAAPMLYTDTVLDLGIGKKEKSGGLAAASHVLRALAHNPFMVCTAVGTVVGLGRIDLPESLMITARMVGSTAAPCALFCMGMSLSAQVTALAGKPWGLWKRQIPMSLCKLCLAPLLVFIFCRILEVGNITLATTTIMAAMPTAVVGHIIAQKHDAAPEDCATAIVINTLLSILTIPTTIMLLRWGGYLAG